MTSTSKDVSTAPVKRPKTIVVHKNTVVTTEARPFLLHDADFLRLTQLHSFIAIWAHTFFAGTAVYFVTLVAKILDTKYLDGQTEVTPVEWITLGILIILVIVFELLHFYLPSDKKKTIRKIREHFRQEGRFPRLGG